MPESAAAAKLPSEVVQGQVRYVTGEIGSGQATAFRRAELHYPLALEFANLERHATVVRDKPAHVDLLWPSGVAG